ncbi:carbohydrate kinase family protein [Spiractinospora alimapuensis]|uniref:carbohydrate kinase family protein n=1 Tax=Spiractinospora alimapuensis TaxID=2820884 RepID=UPI001F3890C8|nr:carbohydrate kinase family protein [Spiractinospora alimapuensis]QVQ51890.1 carbohydrate kinase family protein [Spiractinospora alimapuensis]
MTERRSVVVGVASLGVTLPVERFPVPPGSTSFPQWMEVGVTGVGANVAKAMAILGGSVELCTVLGADPAGLLIEADLRASGLLGVGTVIGHGSSLAVNMTSADGARRTYSHHHPVNEHGYPIDLFERVISDADLIAFTTAAFTRELLEPARRTNATIAVDTQVIADVSSPNRAAWLDVADIVFCSHEKLPCPPVAWIRHIFATYPGCLIATIGCGARGAVMGLRDGTLVHAATPLPRPLVSTIGAGDTLFASFLHVWLGMGNPVQALADAVLHAAFTIGDRFPSRGHLSSAQLRDLSRRHSVEVAITRWDGNRDHRGQPSTPEVEQSLFDSGGGGLGAHGS